MRFKTFDISANNETIMIVEGDDYRERRFFPSQEITKGYWNWLELPDYDLVDEETAYELDELRKKYWE